MSTFQSMRALCEKQYNESLDKLASHHGGKASGGDRKKSMWTFDTEGGASKFADNVNKKDDMSAKASGKKVTVMRESINEADYEDYDVLYYVNIAPDGDTPIYFEFTSARAAENWWKNCMKMYHRDRESTGRYDDGGDVEITRISSTDPDDYRIIKRL